MNISAKRMDTVSTHFFSKQSDEVKRLKEAGIDVISLDIGSPDMPPPKEVVEALCQSAGVQEAHGYQSHRGTDALRLAWAEMYKRDMGVKIDPDQQILPLLGSKEGIFHLMLALVDPGDIVLLPDPYYPTYLKGTMFAGGEPYFMPLLAENDFLPDLSQIPVDVANRAKLMWINYPNNPTAASAPIGFYEEVVAFAQRYNILICHDAAYSQIYYGENKPASFLGVRGAEQVGVEFSSMSKSHNMAGWRSGVVVGNPQVVQTLLTLKTNADSGHFLPILQAAVTALTGNQSWRAARNEVYRKRRDLMVDRLLDLGLETRRPEASFYLWVKVPGKKTAAEFTEQLLRECHVSVAPGTVFGQGGEGYFRISLTQPEARLLEAAGRIEKWMDLA